MMAAAGAEVGGQAGKGGAPLAAQYRAAHEAAILADRSSLGRLAFGGKDALDLLHRLTTNSIKTLQPGEGVAAVFTTAKGRILDLVTFHRTEERLLCLTGPGRAGPVREWVGRYTFREDVEVEDLSRSHGTLGLYGAGAAAAVGRLCGGAFTPGPPHAPVLLEVAGTEILLTAGSPLAGGAFLLTGGASGLPAIRERILLGGGVTEAGEECVEVLRIEAGQPAAGSELTEDYNPWEAGLDDAISLSKGCYVGQEVIARLHTYRKVSKRLVRFEMLGRAVPPPRARVAREGETIGIVTSAAAVPGDERVLALGYVRDEDAVRGRDVAIAWEGAAAVRATILDGSP